jgi:protein-disulfide isomerase
MLHSRLRSLALILCAAAATLANGQDPSPKKAVDGTPFIEAAELEGGPVDMSSLDALQKRRAAQLLNDNLCDCGCKMSLARCRRDDKTCPRSPQVAPALIAALAAGKTDAEAIKAALDVPEPRIAFPVTVGESPARGPASAPVTLIVWVDYQCPFCAKIEPVLKEVVAKYPKDVRLVIKNNPLAIHPHAQFAAEAAVAAQEQGKFWDLHDAMLANTRDVSPERIREWAGPLGIDVARMNAAVESGKLKARVAAEQALVVGLGATGTPASFINGRFVSGSKDFAYFARRIDEEIAWARAGNRPAFAIGKNVAELKPARKDGGRPDPGKRHDVKPGTTPARGAASAKVDIVLWTDYQCPFCKRIEPELAQALADHPDAVRMFVRQNPLKMHADAMPAAQAALAANEQGKFWQMHEKLFENPKDLKRPALERMAEELGLDMARFRKAMDTNAHAAAIEKDVSDATSLRATFTPAVFVGGYLVEGGGPAIRAKVAELLGTAPASPSSPAPVLTSAQAPAVGGGSATKPAASRTVADLTAEAMKLPPAERARLAAALLESLEGTLEAGATARPAGDKPAAPKPGGK